MHHVTIHTGETGNKEEAGGKRFLIPTQYSNSTDAITELTNLTPDLTPYLTSISKSVLNCTVSKD